ncbi:transglutaminase domain-containing protein, partial [Geodermatophilus sp. SYSU D00742]
GAPPAAPPRPGAAPLAAPLGPRRGGPPPPGGRQVPAQSAADAVVRLARAEEAASYARPGSAPTAGADLAAALATARRGLLAGASRRARLRALLVPPSLGRAARDLTARLPRPGWGRRAALRG